MIARITLCLVLVCTLYRVNGEVDLITEPRPGEEYVHVSSGQQTPLRTFETSHKIPEKHPQHRVVNENNEKLVKKVLSSKVKHPSEGIVAIEEEKKSLHKKPQKNKGAESIEVDVPVSKLEDIKIKEKDSQNVETNPDLAVALEAMSESGKLNDAPGTTTQKPILTTASSTTKGFDYIPINFDSIDDINSGLLPSNINLETAGSEQKQHSRIQIKKGPNGQDYEYEYIYYYYDEDDEKTGGKNKAGTSTVASVHNSHDGPQKGETANQVENKSRSKYSTIDRSGPVTTTAAPEIQNEVLPASRGRQRGRNITPAPVTEDLEDISVRLPSSTRFPPRGRNLASASSTTYVPEVSSEIVRQRGRSQSDSVADESIGQTRSRTRAGIRRPSSELVDLDSFKTNSGDIPSQYKEPPTRYSSESRTTTEEPEVETTAKELTNTKDSREGHSYASGIKFQEITDDSKLPADYKQTTTYEQDTTEYTTMTAMEKVALDLYAYLAGENLNNEINPTNEAINFDGTTTVDDDAWTTEGLFTTTEEATTPTTTTTTSTTTTTPAPTTTSTAATRPSRFKGRPGARSRVSTTPATATEAPQETSTRARGRFGKPGGVRKTAATAAIAEVSTQAPASNAEKPTPPKAFGRRNLFAGRTRPSTTAAPAQEEASSAATSEVPVSRARLRPGLRSRGTTSTTAASVVSEDNTAPSASGEVLETTPTPSRSIGRGRPGLRPVSLRPGPRLNLRPNPRLRPGVSSAAPVETSEAPAETSAPEYQATEADPESSSAAPAPEIPARGGLKLRPNRLQVTPSPKPRVQITPQQRRPNPLLRKKPTTEATTEAAKKEESAEDTTSAEKSETETEPVPVESTPAPPLRGLDALIARRRAANAARPSRPARRV